MYCGSRERLAWQRLEGIASYFTQLLQLPPNISQSMHVTRFFRVYETTNIDDFVPAHKGPRGLVHAFLDGMCCMLYAYHDMVPDCVIDIMTAPRGHAVEVPMDTMATEGEDE